MTTRRLLRIEQVQEKIGGWTRKTLYLKIRQGLFPPPIHTGDNTSAWPEDEIDAWIEMHIRERDEALKRKPRKRAAEQHTEINSNEAA